MSVPQRSDVERVVRENLAELTGVAFERIAMHSSLKRDLQLDEDDFTFVFVPAVERALRVTTSAPSWSAVSTVKDAVDLLVRSAPAT